MNFTIRIIMLLSVMLIALALSMFQEPYKNAEEVKAALMKNPRVQELIKTEKK